MLRCVHSYRCHTTNIRYQARIACDLDLLGLNPHVHNVRSLVVGVSDTIKSQYPPSLGNGDIVRHLLLVLDRVARRSEDDIELLQGASLCLNQEEVYDRNEGGIEDGVDDVRLVADVCKGWRDGHHDDEAKDLVRHEYWLKLQE